MALRGFLNAWLTAVIVGLLLMAAFVYVMIRWVVPWLDTAMWNHPVISDGANYIAAAIIWWGWCE